MTNQNNRIESVVEVLDHGDQIALFAHISPDGDTLGSALALYHALKGMGKKVCLCCDGTLPPNLKMLPGYDEVFIQPLFVPNIAMAIDCADAARMGKNVTCFEEAQHRIVIDHHRTNEGFGQINWIDAEAAATAELIYQLLLALPTNITQEEAICLYAALASDTGNFSYSNTRAYSFEMAAELLKTGFDMPTLVRNLFRSKSRSRMRMMGVCLQHAKYYFDGKISLCLLDQQVFNLANPQSGDFDGLVDMLRDQENVEIAIFGREVSPNSFKVSFRSVQSADVSVVAQKWGGGGHARAAACLMQGSYFEVGQALLSALQEILSL